MRRTTPYPYCLATRPGPPINIDLRVEHLTRYMPCPVCLDEGSLVGLASAFAVAHIASALGYQR